MNPYKKQSPTSILQILFTTFAVAALSLATFTAPANAVVQGSAGNTIIRNKVTVNYNDAGGVAQTAVTATVDITVTTVNAAPTIKSVTPSPGTTGATGATQVYAVEIVTNSNGPGTVTLTATDGSAVNIALSGTTPSVQAPGSVFLGSSIIDPNNAGFLGVAQNVAAAGTITFNIPNDGGVPTDSATSGGAPGDSSVNALSAGNTVYIYDGTTYFGKFAVTAVTDNAVGAGNTAAFSTITLQNSTAGAIAFTPAYGWMIVESKSLNVTVTQGVVTVPSNPASWVTTFTGSMGGLNGTSTVTTNATSGLLTVAKYVRNATAPVVPAGPPPSVTPPINGGGVTFYQSGVSGKPGDTMEYLYVITNTGLGTVKAVVATDPVPTYTTLRSSTISYATDNNLGGATGFFARAYRTGNATDQSLKADDSLGDNTIAWGKSSGLTAGSTMTYYLGNNSTNAAGGDLTAAEIAYVVYRLKID